MWKGSRSVPVDSNESVLQCQVTSQEFFFQFNSSSRTKHNLHCTIGCSMITASLNVFFILHYLFLRKWTNRMFINEWIQYQLKYKHSILFLRSHEMRLVFEDQLANFKVVLKIRQNSTRTLNFLNFLRNVINFLMISSIDSLPFCL